MLRLSSKRSSAYLTRLFFKPPATNLRFTSSSTPAGSPKFATALKHVDREPEIPITITNKPTIGTLNPAKRPTSFAPITDTTFVGMSGGQIFHEMMLRQNVEVVFGYPGGAILPVYDAIYNSDYFDFVLPRHEQGGGHMAEGYSKVTGKPGVVLVTSGPGATNMITPMQDALSDGIPMVVFCGQVPTSALGTDAFQEADVIGISRCCTKWNVQVRNVADLPRRINEAFEIATSGRPGPVLVELPKDVTAAILTKAVSVKGTQTDIPGRKPHHASDGVSALNLERIEKVAQMLNKAKKPILYVGGGI